MAEVWSSTLITESKCRWMWNNANSTGCDTDTAWHCYSCFIFFQVCRASSHFAILVSSSVTWVSLQKSATMELHSKGRAPFTLSSLSDSTNSISDVKSWSRSNLVHEPNQILGSKRANQYAMKCLEGLVQDQWEVPHEGKESFHLRSLFCFQV